MIIVIGLRLSGSAVSNAIMNNGEFDYRYALIALLVIAIVIVISVFTKGLLNLMPIFWALVIGYIAFFLFNIGNFGDWWSAVSGANFISFTDSHILDQLLVAPVFEKNAIIAIAPIAIVTIIEHVGDITTNGAVVGENFIADPGVHRTLLGDGLATAFAGLIGGPANTTYGENTGEIGRAHV